MCYADSNDCPIHPRYREVGFGAFGGHDPHSAEDLLEPFTSNKIDIEIELHKVPVEEPSGQLAFIPRTRPNRTRGVVELDNKDRFFVGGGVRGGWD